MRNIRKIDDMTIGEYLEHKKVGALIFDEEKDIGINKGNFILMTNKTKVVKAYEKLTKRKAHNGY